MKISSSAKRQSISKTPALSSIPIKTKSDGETPLPKVIRLPGRGGAGSKPRLVVSEEEREKAGGKLSGTIKKLHWPKSKKSKGKHKEGMEGIAVQMTSKVEKKDGPNPQSHPYTNNYLSDSLESVATVQFVPLDNVFSEKGPLSTETIALSPLALHQKHIHGSPTASSSRPSHPPSIAKIAQKMGDLPPHLIYQRLLDERHPPPKKTPPGDLDVETGSLASVSTTSERDDSSKETFLDDIDVDTQSLASVSRDSVVSATSSLSLNPTPLDELIHYHRKPHFESPPEPVGTMAPTTLAESASRFRTALKSNPPTPRTSTESDVKDTATTAEPRPSLTITITSPPSPTLTTPAHSPTRSEAEIAIHRRNSIAPSVATISTCRDLHRFDLSVDDLSSWGEMRDTDAEDTEGSEGGQGGPWDSLISISSAMPVDIEDHQPTARANLPLDTITTPTEASFPSSRAQSPCPSPPYQEPPTENSTYAQALRSSIMETFELQAPPPPRRSRQAHRPSTIYSVASDATSYDAPSTISSRSSASSFIQYPPPSPSLQSFASRLSLSRTGSMRASSATAASSNTSLPVLVIVERESMLSPEPVKPLLEKPPLTPTTPTSESGHAAASLRRTSEDAPFKQYQTTDDLTLTEADRYLRMASVKEAPFTSPRDKAGRPSTASTTASTTTTLVSLNGTHAMELEEIKGRWRRWSSASAFQAAAEHASQRVVEKVDIDVGIDEDSEEDHLDKENREGAGAPPSSWKGEWNRELDSVIASLRTL